MQKFGIDISKWQADFDIKRAKEQEGVEFVILKAGGGDAGLYKDKQFENNYKKCKDNQLPVGAYFFGNARSVEQAIKEADYFLSLLQGKQFEYPVFYDIEAGMLLNNKRDLTDIAVAFCDRLERNKYWVGIYSSLAVFNANFHTSEISKYTHWIASWGTKKPVAKEADTQLWQFGGETNKIRSNKINGITVDQNYCFIDFPTLIKSQGLNGFSNIKFEDTSKKSVPTLATEVIQGRHGTNQARRDSLGADYYEVQEMVNYVCDKFSDLKQALKENGFKDEEIKAIVKELN